jgi:ribosome maturation factor RimP
LCRICFECEGARVPIFIFNTLITKDFISTIIKEYLELNTGLFLVDLSVSNTGKIAVFIDKIDGMIDIEQCVLLSKFIESKLDREVQDFELQVSSAGMTSAFKVKEQYLKNLNKSVKILTYDGKKHEGVLKEVDEDKLVIEYQVKEKIEGRKKKELVTKIESYYFNSDTPDNKIKETKKVISFN